MDKVLNPQFAIPNQFQLVTFDSGLTFANIQNRSARASICLQGGHVTEFTPAGSSPVLWVSDKAKFEPGAAIRGGVPVMWPWFGAKQGYPQHGFVRTLPWELLRVDTVDDQNTRVVLALSDSAVTRNIWRHSFDLQLEILIGPELELRLTARNTGSASIETGGGFHPYFSVGDIRSISVRGLAGLDYLDKVTEYARYTLKGDLRFSAEVDRVFLNTQSSVVISDPALGRRIRIDKSGSDTTVVWNPWQEVAKQMTDFTDDGYREMVCVEAVNAFDDMRTLEPGASHAITQTISTQRL